MVVQKFAPFFAAGPVSELLNQITLVERDAGKGALLLEEADHAVLAALIKTFPFAIAHKDLPTVIDDVLHTEAPAE